MANEFVARNGLIAQDTSRISGSLLVTAGNIGVGTATPANRLHVIQDSSTAGISVSGVGTNPQLRATDGTRIAKLQALIDRGIVGTESNNDFSIFTNNSEIVRITTTGNVGIGSTAPTSKLQVIIPESTSGVTGVTIVGNTNSKVLALGASSTYAFVQSHGSVPLYINELGNNVIINPAAGNVGIGTTSPTVKLDVSGSVNVRSVAPTITFDRNGSYTWRLVNGDGGTYPLSTFNIGNNANTAIATFLDGGNVGIGITTPVSRLHVQQSITTVTTASLDNNTAVGLTVSYPDTTLSGGEGIAIALGMNGRGRSFIANIHTSTSKDASDIAFYNESGAIISEKVRINSLGNVGIGTSIPGAKLDVVGNVRAQSFTGSFSGSAAAPGSNNQIIFNSSGSLAASSGFVFTGTNVGIGAISPAYLLEVSGSVGITGGNSLTFGSTGTKTATIRHDASGLVISANIQNQYLSLGSSPAGSQNFPNGIFHYGGAHVFYSSTTEVARIDTSGNVGIGTTAPGEKLQVQGNIRFGTGGQASWGNGLLAVTNSWDGGATSYATIGSYGGSTGALIMLINPHTPFRTDNASGGYTGRAGLRMSANAGASVYWDAGLAGDFYHIFRQGTGEFLRINNVGNIGIGTTAPTGALQVHGVLSVSNNSVIGQGNIYGTSGAASYATLKLYDSATGNTDFNNQGYNIQFQTAGSTKLYIKNDGNIGIGTTSPDEKLVVQGNSARIKIQTASNPTVYYTYIESNYNAANTFNIVDNGTRKFGSITNGVVSGDTYVSSYYGISFSTSTTTADSSSMKMYITQAGNIGIGTYFINPTAKLHVSGTTGGIFEVDGANAITGLYVSASGNVGIGISNPTSRLQVSGSSNTVNVKGSGSALFSVDGTVGRLFQVDDSLSGSLFSVNTAAGLPVIEAFSDNTVRIGQFGQRALFVSQSRVGIGLENPTVNLHVSGTTGGVFEVDGANAINALYVSSSGNVGIGTTSVESIANTTTLTINGSTGGGATSYQVGGVRVGLANGNDNYFTLQSYNSRPLSLGYNGTNTLIINTSNNVGIGTTAPSRILHVLSSVWDNTAGAGVIFENSNTVGSGITLKPNASVVTNGSSGWAMYAGGPGSAIGDGNLGFWAHGTNQSRLTIQRGGNVGIGSNTPGATLDVVGNIRAQSFTGSFSGSAAAPGTNTQVVFNSSGSLAASSGFVFTGTSVGIGTTAPGYRLQVTGSTHLQYLQIQDGGYAGGLPTTPEIYSPASATLAISAGGSERFRISSTGNVGIGTTTPGSKLTVIGDIATSTRVAADTINGYTGGSTPLTIQTGGAQNIIFGTNATERMRLDTNGNLGIGASVPIARLHAGVNLSDYSTQTFTNTGAIITSIGVDHTASRTNVLSLMRDGTSGVVYAGLAAFDLSRWSSDGVNARTQLDIRLANTDTATITDVLSLRSDGNVGIGVTSSLARLHVSGTTGGVFEVDGVNATNALYVSSSGFVGIGTTTPGNLLTVNGNMRLVTGTTQGLFAYDSSVGGSFIYSLTRYTNHGTNDLNINALGGFAVKVNSSATVNTGHELYISSSGNVGLGTTAPTTRLDVYTSGTTGTTSMLLLRRAAGYGHTLFDQTYDSTYFANGKTLTLKNDSGTAFAHFAGNNSGTQTDFLLPSGSAGIGNTNPSSFSVDANTLVLGSTSTTLAGMTIANNTAGTGGIYFADGTVGNQAYRGYISYIHSTDELTIGTGGSGRIYVSSTGATSFTSTVTALSFIETSTREKKDNIQSYSTDINKFKQLKPVSYTWKDTGKSDVGLIAEEVDQLFPEFVSKTDEGEVTGINYGKLTTILINIVKQQQERIEKLEQQINK